jgi:hypothetical protein
VRDIRADEDQVAALVPGDMVTDMPGSCRTVDVHDLIFGMEMPIELVIQPRREEDAERTVRIGTDLFANDFHGLI